MTLLGWAVDQPSFSLRADHLVRLMTSAIISSPADSEPKRAAEPA
jgi:hypothetical protein